MFFHDKIREEGRSKQFSVKTELVDFVDQLSQSRYSPLLYLVFFRCLQGGRAEGDGDYVGTTQNVIKLCWSSL